MVRCPPSGDHRGDDATGTHTSRERLLLLVEDFERLWAVPGFAERLAADLGRPRRDVVVPDPYDDPWRAVLVEHRSRVAAALRDLQRHGDLSADRDVDDLGHALLGSYLSRRLACCPTDGWAGIVVASLVR